jgi:competence protein ComEA
MFPALREAASRVTARVTGSRFAKPVARVVLAAAGLFLLAFIGKTAVAGAMAPVPNMEAPSASALAAPAPPPIAPVVPAVATPAPAEASPTTHTQATADDPVFLNTATADDLRRLPGIGEKRADAILALRLRLGGRFRSVEDLLKVKGIGRATLRRLRPLVRLDPLPQPDGGAAEAPR